MIGMVHEMLARVDVTPTARAFQPHRMEPTFHCVTFSRGGD
jgi:hypothetical protein